jgi:hypothetical protein
VVGNGRPDGATYPVTKNAGPVTLPESTGAVIEQRVVPAAVPSRPWVPAAWRIGLMLVVAGVIASARRRREPGTTTR